MSNELTPFEVAEAYAKYYPKGKTPIFGVISNENGELLGVDFENGPFCVLDETGEDYGLKADQFINDSTPVNTKRAYNGDIQYFNQWVSYAVSPVGNWPISEETVLKFIFHHLEEMPANVEEDLISSGWKRTRGPHSLATVKRRLVSLSILHKFNKCADPCDNQKVKSLISAFSKTLGKQKKSKAITKNILDNLVATCSKNSLIDIRDKALLLFGFSSGGRRRSEISDACMENLQETSDGDYVYKITKSKTDQKGKGLDVPIKGKAAHALRQWLLATGIKNGKIFRSVGKGGGMVGESITPVDINRIVKSRCRKAGYDESCYTAHSLRSGFITEAGKQNCSLGDTMALSGHRSVPTAMGYFQSGNVLNNKAANLAD